jgi:hypothetical protein
LAASQEGLSSVKLLSVPVIIIRKTQPLIHCAEL